MKTLPIVKAVALSLVLVGSSGITFAQQGPWNNNFDRMEQMREMRQPGNHLLALPGLTDEQKEQIREVMLETRKEMLPIQNQVREKRAQLRTLRTSENADMKAINSMVDEISGLRAGMMKTRLASEQEIRNLLTEEQRIIFDSRSPMGKKPGMAKKAFRMWHDN
ncbi:MAG: Spy/CpxP family protein refolding chaperone [Balneolaceae bacterium]|nr:Spy/CpxP family protein refolding chaperone [Balneolaceae bacterium]